MRSSRRETSSTYQTRWRDLTASCVLADDLANLRQVAGSLHPRLVQNGTSCRTASCRPHCCRCRPHTPTPSCQVQRSACPLCAGEEGECEYRKAGGVTRTTEETCPKVHVVTGIRENSPRCCAQGFLTTDGYLQPHLRMLHPRDGRSPERPLPLGTYRVIGDWHTGKLVINLAFGFWTWLHKYYVH